jgi:hypothetical protein
MLLLFILSSTEVLTSRLALVPNALQQPVQIIMTFSLDTDLMQNDIVTVALPRFFRGVLGSSSVVVSPSTKWSAVWTDGRFLAADPYADTTLVLTVKTARYGIQYTYT